MDVCALFTGERLKSGGEDLALMVNASQPDRTSDDDED